MTPSFRRGATVPAPPSRGTQPGSRGERLPQDEQPGTRGASETRAPRRASQRNPAPGATAQHLTSLRPASPTQPDARGAGVLPHGRKDVETQTASDHCSARAQTGTTYDDLLRNGRGAPSVSQTSFPKKPQHRFSHCIVGHDFQYCS